MKNLHTLQMPELVDLLAQQTSKVSKKFTEKRFDEEYDKQKFFLMAIQDEIDFRRTVADVITNDIE